MQAKYSCTHNSKTLFLSQGGTIEQRNPKAKGTHRAQTCCPLWGTTFCQGPLELLLPLSLQLLLVLGLAPPHPLFTEEETEDETQVLPTLILASGPGWLLHAEL